MLGGQGDYTPPDWYFIIRSARYLGVEPWKLAGLDESVAALPIWCTWAFECENAETYVSNKLAEKARGR